MSEKIKRVQPNIQVGGTEAFVQESEKNLKFRTIGFEEGKCHRRIIIKSKMETVVDDETGRETQVAMPGYAVLHMFEDFLGIPVKNEGYRENGYEIEPDYTKTIYNKLMADILAFDTDNYQATGEVDLKKGFANFIRYVYNFSTEFQPDRNKERMNIIVLKGFIFRPTAEQLSDPEFDIDKATINHLKDSWNKELGTDKFSDIFQMTFWEAVKTWILKETRYKIPFTPVANANFSGVPYYGALPDSTTEEGKHQQKVISLLASVARVLSQHNFEKESKNAVGLTRGTEAYNKMYDAWVGEPKTNRQLVGRPSLNGVIFVLDSVCNESCNQLEKDKKGELKMREYIHNVNPNKLAKIDKTTAYDSVLMNPDFVDVVMKYTTGDTKALMGQQMSCVKWEGREDTFVPFKDIKKLIDQTNSPSMPERINSYQPFPFEDFVDAFKKFLVKLNENDGLAWIKEDEALLNTCKPGFEAIGFDLDVKAVSVEDVLKQANMKAPGVSAAAGLGIAITAPTPQPTATPAAPAPTITEPVAPQPTATPVAPQPEIPVPNTDI